MLSLLLVLAFGAVIRATSTGPSNPADALLRMHLTDYVWRAVSYVRF